MRRRGDEIQISNLNFQILNPPRLRVELIRRALKVNPALRACQNQTGRLSLPHSQARGNTRDRDETHHSHRAGLGPATADGLPVTLFSISESGYPTDYRSKGVCVNVESRHTGISSPKILPQAQRHPAHARD